MPGSAEIPSRNPLDAHHVTCADRSRLPREGRHRVDACPVRYGRVQPSARQQVAQTTEVLHHFGTSFLMGLNTEAGQRGFLTGDTFRLADYGTGELACLTRVHDLDRATAGMVSDGQTAAGKRMRGRATEKVAEFAETLRPVRANDLDGAIALVRSDQGKGLMGRFRAGVTALDEQEQSILPSAITRADIIKARTLPIFVNLMMDDPTEGWGRPSSPVVDDGHATPRVWH